tara:strand:- start:1021 stop:1725 length:705 start_codon:yes stop_codon:yes gene_type:complete
MGFKDNSDCGKSYFRGNAENNMTWGSDSEIQWNSATGGDNCDCSCSIEVTEDNGTIHTYNKCCGYINKDCGNSGAMVMPNPKDVKKVVFRDPKKGDRNISMSEYRKFTNVKRKLSISGSKSNLKSVISKVKKSRPENLSSLSRATGVDVVVVGGNSDFVECDCHCVSWSDEQMANGGGIVTCCGQGIKCGTFKFKGFGGAMVNPIIEVTYNSMASLKGKGKQAPTKKTRFNGFI